MNFEPASAGKPPDRAFLGTLILQLPNYWLARRSGGLGALSRAIKYQRVNAAESDYRNTQSEFLTIERCGPYNSGLNPSNRKLVPNPLTGTVSFAL